MSARSLAGLMILGSLACGDAGLSQHEIESKTAELVEKTYARFGDELQALERDGLTSEEPMSIGFSFRCRNKSRAQALKTTIEETTPYRVKVLWFKEPEEGWSVHGDIPLVAPTAISDRDLLIRMVTLGLRHSCEIRWWQPTLGKRQQLSNCTAASEGGRQARRGLRSHTRPPRVNVGVRRT